jgi:hypothetical protein
MAAEPRRRVAGGDRCSPEKPVGRRADQFAGRGYPSRFRSFVMNMFLSRFRSFVMNMFLSRIEQLFVRGLIGLRDAPAATSAAD